MPSDRETEMEGLLAKIEARMASGEPFTFTMLWAAHGNSFDPAYRLADRTIQKWRKKGWIERRDKSRPPTWYLTDARRQVMAEPTP